MKFTHFTLSLALTSMVSAAAIPALPGADGVVGGLEGAADGVVAGVAGGHLKRQTQILDTIEHDLGNNLAGHLKRQLEVVQPVTESVASSLNGGTGIVGSAVGTAESTGQGAVGTVESTVAGSGHLKRQLPGVDTVKQTISDTLGDTVKRQLEAVQPVTESVASSLNGGTGIIGSAAGTAESTGQGAVGTVESTLAGVGSGIAYHDNPLLTIIQLTITQLPSVNSVTFPLQPPRPVPTSWLVSQEVCFLLISPE